MKYQIIAGVAGAIIPPLILTGDIVRLGLSLTPQFALGAAVFSASIILLVAMTFYEKGEV